MSRPQIVVNVTAALQRRGAPTDTGVAFMVYAGAGGPSTPTKCYSVTDATTASVPATQAAWVGDAMTQGAPYVWVLRAAAVDPDAVTNPEWDTALAKLTAEYGPGQVFIPGVATSAAHTALIDHAGLNPARCVLLDGANNSSASALAAFTAAVDDGDGAERATLIAPWVTVPGAGGTPREVPGSVIAAGLAARGDAYNGHANNAPIWDQGRSAGVIQKGLTVTTSYTDAEADTLADAGVSLIRSIRTQPTLTDWKSVSSDDRFRQFNWGRFSMQLSSGVAALMEQFLGRQIDGRGLLFSEVAGTLRGYLNPFYQSANPALFGATADDAFDVDTVSPNTSETIAAGELNGQVAVSLSPFTEQVTIDITTSIAEGVAA